MRAFPSATWRGPAIPASTRDRVILVIQRTAARSFALRDDQHLWNDLRIDEQTRMELFMALELQFAKERVDFTEEEIATYSTVGALVALVERKVRGDV